MSLLKRISGFPTWLFLLFIGLLIYIPFIGNVHLFDWDEISTAESAREMLLTHNFRTVQINFQPFYEKPPLFIWLQALSMSYFGVNEFGARFPNAIIGILTLLTVYQVGKKYFNDAFGIWWALLFASSVLPQLYFKSALIDPLFNYLIFLSLYFLFIISIKDDFEPNKLRRKNHRRYLIASALAVSLAVLTKGPIALGLVVAIVSIVLLLNRGRLTFTLPDLILWAAVVITMIAIWLTIEIRSLGIGFVDNFIAYQIHQFTQEEAGRGGAFYYHMIALLIGCFPASILCLEAFRRNNSDTLHQLSFKRWMIVLLVVALLFFSVLKTKIMHYSTLCYFPITFLAAYYIYHLSHLKWQWTWRQSIPLLIFGLGFATIAGGMMWAGAYNIQLPLFTKDRFGIEALNAIVYWNEREIAICIAYAIAVMVSVILLSQKHTIRGLSLLLLATCIFVNVLTALIAPRIEKYSQGAMLEFIESKKLEDCYIEVMGYKSYAQLFYSDKKMPHHKQDTDMNYILHGNHHRPVYIISRVNQLQSIDQPEMYEELYRKNGYVFMKRCQ